MLKASDLLKSKVLEAVFGKPKLKNGIRLLIDNGIFPSAHSKNEIRPIDIVNLLYVLCSYNSKGVLPDIKSMLEVKDKMNFIYYMARFFSILHDAIMEIDTEFEYVKRIEYFESGYILTDLEHVMIGNENQEIVYKEEKKEKDIKFGSQTNDNFSIIRGAKLSEWFLIALFFDIITNFEYGEKINQLYDTDILHSEFNRAILGRFDLEHFKVVLGLSNNDILGTWTEN